MVPPFLVIFTNIVSKLSLVNSISSSVSNQQIRDALHDWKNIVSKYQVADAKKATIQLINSFGPFIGLWILIYFSLDWSIFLAIPLLLINAFFLVRIFIIQHDCGHQSFFNSKALNNAVGTICSFFCGIPYKYWAKVHNFHHGHNGQLEVRDVGDIPTLTVKEYLSKSKPGKFFYRVWRNPIVLFGIAPMYYIIITNRYNKEFGKNLKITRNQILNNLGILVVYAILGYLLGWAKFLTIQLSIIFFFGIIAFWFFYVQHQHESAYKEWRDKWDFLIASIKGSSYYKLPRVWHWLTGNIGYHHIHHLNSLIPNYNLPKCYKENPILNKYVTEITFFKSLSMYKHKLWDEDLKKMVSFKQLKNKYKQMNKSRSAL